MTTSSSRTAYAGARHRMLCAFLAFACAGPSLPPALAATESEITLTNSPLPHERLAGNSLTKVHWVRLQGYFEDASGHASMMNDLKAQVQSCVLSATHAGRQTRPPQVWPDYVNINQRDAYDAPNRSISYDTTLLYTVNPFDCSLSENYRRSATLASSKGICEVDLVNKTAHGFCDVKAHADALPLVRTGAQIPDDKKTLNAPNRAAMEALEKAMMLAPGKTGERKKILGIGCDVWKSPFDPNGMACLSRDGSFVASHAAFGLAGSSMELEIISTLGVNLRAVKAELDGKVNASVFAPYRADGFNISQNGAPK